MSHEWQGPLRSGEKPPVESEIEKSDKKPEEKSEKISDVEKELSPEVIEMIMDKVQDVEKDGTAFTQLRNFEIGSNVRSAFNESNFLENILREGVLGWFQKIRQICSQILEDMKGRRLTLWDFCNSYQKFLSERDSKKLLGDEMFSKLVKFQEEEQADSNDQYLEEAFVKKFIDHILGEDCYNKLVNGQIKIDDNESIKKLWKNFIKKNKIGIVWFNVVGGSIDIKDSHYINDTKPDEIILLFDLLKYQETEKMFNEYNYSEFKKEPFEAKKWGHRSEWNKKWGIDSEYGVTLRNRISPKDFLGVVMTNPLKMESLISSQTKVYREKQKLLLPIYNINGNLLWPKQMSYEEVKKFVAERDAKKRKKEENV